MSNDPIAAHFQNSLAGLTVAAADPALQVICHAIAAAAVAALRDGRKLLIAGNGGSAADAQHIAAEIVGRYKLERRAWPAIALTTDTSVLTAITNDYGFEQVFSRQIQGLGQSGDVFWGLSTSGKSPNVLAALRVAREQGLVTVGFTGSKGTAMAAHCDHLLVAPSDDTPVIQQIHLMAAHAICDQIERAMIDAGTKASAKA
ncbi:MULTISPECIES: D-sedoheptulose 7-phosphate isomerase [Rhodopseudomonas]|uniref:Phosphoheptose isomerase n=1 Tax=Rhodopseudomonas palustris TaxID=1076 RepID=A0A0D7DWE6_RHOPL|nr:MULTISPECIES: D-sedoheptulose 7-phosphate isomerase [Rhodopseudomonas]KIZ32606.1 sugar isomerase [Rhodopseudomonas palustris]MDF3812775.1 D-sedoheptulose 7-phosphate isomerase [Rhodopseudomonas sp. BAL398]WOK20338.1 D-sedoheptulose 7-phosphate isomerase [Rhodopseudomonas sp. BAL398]